MSACSHTDGFERRDKLANKVIKIIKMLNKGEDGDKRYKGLGGTSSSWEIVTGCGQGGVEVGGLGRMGCGVHQVTIPSGSPIPGLQLALATASSASPIHCLPRVPCTGDWGNLGAQAHSHYLGKFFQFKTNCPQNRHVLLLEIVISKSPFY